MFANAESLFYYTSFSRQTKKLLSLEEVKQLLAQAMGQPAPLYNTTEVHNITDGEAEGGENSTQCNGDGTAITEIDDEEVENETNTKANSSDKPNLDLEINGIQEEGETFTDNVPQGDYFVDEVVGTVQPTETYMDGQEAVIQDMEIGGSTDTAHNHLQEHDADGDHEEYTQLDEDVEV